MIMGIVVRYRNKKKNNGRIFWEILEGIGKILNIIGSSSTSAVLSNGSI